MRIVLESEGYMTEEGVEAWRQGVVGLSKEAFDAGIKV